MKEEVRELLTTLLALPDGSPLDGRLGVCGYLASRAGRRNLGSKTMLKIKDWCRHHATLWLIPGRAFVDYPPERLTPKRRQFVEYLLTKIDELSYFRQPLTRDCVYPKIGDTMREKVRELLTALLAMPDGATYQGNRYAGVCGYLISDLGFQDEPERSEVYGWSEENAAGFLGSRNPAFVDRPANVLTPKRRQFVEFLLTKLEELPE